ncbi:MAG: hypothetical protein ACI87E_001491 [Mariniblastus sp.]|jgi:hypothetical protein
MARILALIPIRSIYSQDTALTLFDINTDPFDPTPEYVRVEETHIGKAVFAHRAYPRHAVIGEILGELSADLTRSDEYTFEFDDELQLDPYEPFRYLNHCCEPNCEFEILDQPETDEQPGKSSLFLIAIQEIQPGDALTIDYNWPASHAMPCECRDPSCRGWIVSIDELDKLGDPEDRVELEDSSLDRVDSSHPSTA